MSNDRVLDLFRGAGGWSVAARALGLTDDGVECMPEANATATAAGFNTLSHDVRDLDYRFLQVYKGLIASPPCQTFSLAGKGKGREALEAVLKACEQFKSEAETDWPEYAELAEATGDERTALVLEPLRAALSMPDLEWVAWEQVPTVRPVWEACAEVLRSHGWSVWTGVLQAEKYGVPQTRKRAVLTASKVREVSEPTPTHSAYYPRNPSKVDAGMPRWVSMAQALGLADECIMRSNYGTGGDASKRGERTQDEPAPTVTSKIDRNKWQVRLSAQDRATVREGSEPAPTIAFGNDWGSAHWRFAGAGSTAQVTSRQVPRASDAPAHTITGEGTAAWVPTREEAEEILDLPNGTEGADPRWPWVRPATSVVGSFRPEIMAAPGYRVKVSRQNAAGSVRVTVQEAAVLQSFPADYPFQGKQGKQFLQVGNAVPPGLAYHILKSVI